jgi:hypothetical protein
MPLLDTAARVAQAMGFSLDRLAGLDKSPPPKQRKGRRGMRFVQLGRSSAAAVALFRRVQLILGILMVGGGLCTAYFCWTAFAEAREAVRIEVPDFSADPGVKKAEVNP